VWRPHGKVGSGRGDICTQFLAGSGVPRGVAGRSVGEWRSLCRNNQV